MFRDRNILLVVFPYGPFVGVVSIVTPKNLISNFNC